MSIPFSVAATLARGEIEEENYSELGDADIVRLISVTELESDAGLTAAFPGKQGAEVIVHLRDGRIIRHALPDVIAATPADIRARFRNSAAGVLGEDRARRLEQLIDDCEQLGNAGDIAAQCRLNATERALRSAS
jgi:2-methylcitrate dehydratase PrpD